MFFKKSLSRFGGIFDRPDHQEIIRNYLDRSVSIVDLERRQREVDQGKFNRF